MLHRFVAGEVIGGALVEKALVSVQAALAGDVLTHDLGHRHLVGVGDVEGSHSAAALNKRDDRALVGGAGAPALRRRGKVLVARPGMLGLAEVGFVGLNDPVLAA